MSRNLAATALFVLTTLLSSAQGNLQFNRVVNLNYTGTQSPTSSNASLIFQTSTITVPQGKVWKIESAGVKLTLTSNPILNYLYSWVSYTNLLLNNIPIAQEKANNNNSIYSSAIPEKSTSFPIWLSSGSYPISLQGYNDSGNSFTAYGCISAIEFNIVP